MQDKGKFRCDTCKVEFIIVSNNTLFQPIWCPFCQAKFEGAPNFGRIQRIAARDGWKCHLCGKMINPHTTNKRDRATVDHLIPKSEGGKSGLDNIKLAHLSCNNKRGTIAMNSPKIYELFPNLGV